MAIVFPVGNDGDIYEAPNGIIYQFSDGAWRLSAENQGSVGVHMGTSPPGNPQNGDLWFHTGEADLKIFYIDPTSSQWVPASSPPDPFEENFVSITGDTMTGRLTILKDGIRLNKEDDTRQLTVSPNGGDYYTNIFSHNTNGVDNSLGKKGGIRVRVAPKNGTEDYKTTFISEWNPHRVGGEDHNVRSTVAFLQDPIKKHHAAHKSYVDTSISNALLHTIPGRRFDYSNNHTDNLPSGCFHVEGNGNVQVSRFDKDGVELAPAYRDDFKSAVKFVVSIRDTDGALFHSMSCDHWYTGQNNPYHLRYNKAVSHKNGKANFVSGRTYYIAEGIYCL